jgi:hypothetical protein
LENRGAATHFPALIIHPAYECPLDIAESRNEQGGEKISSAATAFLEVRFCSEELHPACLKQSAEKVRWEIMREACPADYFSLDAETVRAISAKTE